MWDWSHYLRLAERLKPAACAKDGEIARARSAISRAYYAAFNAMREHVEAKNIEVLHDEGRGPKRVSSTQHRKWWDALAATDSISDDEREAALQGGRLHSMRLHADYENATSSHKIAKQLQRLTSDVESALIMSHKIFTLLGRALPQLPPTPASSSPPSSNPATE